MKVKCRFTLLAKFRLWMGRRGQPDNMCPCLCFSSRVTSQGANFDKDKIDQIGNEIASAKDITERNKIGLKYGFRWDMAGSDYMDESTSDSFLCESMDGIRFLSDDQEMIQHLSGKKISLTKEYELILSNS